jgi:magnesium-transporting ATPase (P-type)
MATAAHPQADRAQEANGCYGVAAEELTAAPGVDSAVGLIAGGQPFTPPQVLWIHFFISAPFGVALGLDQATPGLMRRRRRPHDESIVNSGVTLTCGLVGLYMATVLDVLIYFGKQHYHSATAEEAT